MRLLVSVRSVEEAHAAVRGGADIVDAKEPSAGALAPVPVPVLAAIAQATPPHVPLSAALGDIATPREVVAAIASLPIAARRGEVYVKFAPTDDRSRAPEIVRAAVTAAGRHPARPSIVVAAYVDRFHDRWSDLTELARASADAGARGVLLDTAVKDGWTLFDWCSAETLAEFTGLAHARGLLVALAGSVSATELPVLAATGADIVGVRGAVCSNGRAGQLDGPLVFKLAHHLGQISDTPFAPVSHT